MPKPVTVNGLTLTVYDDGEDKPRNYRPPPQSFKDAATTGFKPTPPDVAGEELGAPIAVVSGPSKGGGGGGHGGGGKAVPDRPDIDTVAVRLRDPTATNDQTTGLVPPKAQLSKQQQAEEATMMEQSVKHPPTPNDFQGLQMPNSISIQMEPNQALQVETSDAMLRSLSPFMIRVEPPLIYGEDGGFQNKKVNSVATDFSVGSGFGTDLTGYDQARKALAQSGIAGFNTSKSRVGSIQEFVSNNSTPNTNPSADGSMANDAGGNLGVPAIADVYTAVDIARQLAAMINTPPLVLLVNPTTFSVAYNKIQQYQERTRYGYVFQAWGEEQPKLSFTARCGAFISGGRGVQFASKRDSMAWQNLMNAFTLFRNAGYIYDTVGKSNAHLSVGSLSIRYDGWIYYGHIESFNFTQDDEHMHGGVEFSIEFVASAMVDTAQPPFVVTPMKSPMPSPSDPRYQGMGNVPDTRAGNFSIGSDGKVRTQGREVGVGDAFLSMVPQNGVNTFGGSFKTPDSTQVGKSLADQPPSNKGFVNASTTNVGPGERAVSVASPSSVEPFRVGSSS